MPKKDCAARGGHPGGAASRSTAGRYASGTASVSLARLNAAHSARKPGTRRAPCPECNKGRRDDALSITVKPDGSAVWLCHRCGFKGGMRAPGERPRAFRGRPMDRTAVHPKPPAQSGALREHQSPVLAGPWRMFWCHDCLSLADGSPAAVYLRGRGCSLPHPDGDLRWFPEARHPGGHVGPALVALVTDAITGDPLNLHRTWIKPDGGGKAEIDRPRLLLKNHRKAGGVIRLWPDEEVTTGLCVAEGIETALTAAIGFGLAWSCIDAGNLSALPVLSGIEALTIVADHDPPNPRTGKRAGEEAARACARRWADAGREVRVWTAPAEGMDFNDLAKDAAA